MKDIRKKKYHRTSIVGGKEHHENPRSRKAGSGTDPSSAADRVRPGSGVMRHYEDIKAIYQQPLSPTPRKPRQTLPGSSERLVMGIDPGPVESAYALVAPDYAVVLAEKAPTHLVYGVLDVQQPVHVVIESLQSYGMPVGRSVFETAYTIGKLLRECERYGIPTTLYCRQEYARALCGIVWINDATVKQALELRFGGYRKGEPLALLRGNSDKRSAFAVAVYYLDCKYFAQQVPAVGCR